MPETNPLTLTGLDRWLEVPEAGEPETDDAEADDCGNEDDGIGDY